MVSMGLIWLDDECEPRPSKKQKAGKETAADKPLNVKQTTKTASVASMSSTSSFLSGSSSCSAFARRRPRAPDASDEDDDCKVRIAIGGL